MTLYLAIGATAEPEETACHSAGEWEALLDANERGDLDAVLRLIATPPTMLPTASLRSHPRADEADELPEFAREFWREYRQREGAPPLVRRGGVQIDVAPNKANERTNEILRRIAESGGES